MVINKLMSFLNLLDSEGKLSITNVAVYITLIKLAVSPSASITEAGTLLLALGNYAHKRIVNNSNQTEPEDLITPQVNELKENIEKITSQVSAMALNNGLTKLK